MKERSEHGTASNAEMRRLRESFETGAAWTKESALRRLGIPDRRFRAAVSMLRESGYPVVSTSEAGSTYRKARSRTELEDFIARELRSRARDIEAQIRALEDAAVQHFGTDQLALAI